LNKVSWLKTGIVILNDILRFRTAIRYTPLAYFVHSSHCKFQMIIVTMQSHPLARSIHWAVSPTARHS